MKYPADLQEIEDSRIKDWDSLPYSATTQMEMRLTEALLAICVRLDRLTDLLYENSHDDLDTSHQEWHDKLLTEALP